ncbi:hypothetical protein SAMN04487905_104133 [Actinopolyspora xinjiangensis]|uniref:Uncharacterized protein n=1 Tax=Actinopolyspora xinjiangensis TaxID=405564 RepID=A0A1H0SRI4_9ACTN|nr:hypothetical protein SAMN04487905_104133 [Actinopolyspora xinjiangensis]
MTVLLLLLVAAGVLVFAVATGAAQWAWLSVLLCAVAAVMLFWARVRDRRRFRSAPRHSAHGTAGVADAAPPVEEEAASVGESETSSSEGGSEGSSQRGAEPDPDTEPAEQRTDAADVLLVSEAETVVFVIDERPRYHLDDCSWVGDRETLPLPVAEARELGFTPCAVCAPDSSVARLARSHES